MQKSLTISKKEARILVLQAQKLLHKSPFEKGSKGILQTIQHLGYIQIDTISVIERAHHHTFYNRQATYNPDFLHQLQISKHIFEYWSHAAAYLPMSDFRFSLSRKRAIAAGEKHWFEREPKTMKQVLDRIRAEGPLQAKDFKAPPAWKQQEMWQWKPAKRALEQLFIEGELMIVARKGFQKIYDLTERVLPEDVDTRIPSDTEMAEHLIYSYLKANALGMLKQITHLRRVPIKKQVKAVLDKKLAAGEIVSVQIEGISASYFALENLLEDLPKSVNKNQVKLLSPFDNAVIQRERLTHIFDFDYQIECYVPKAKRRFGYFCLPILWGDRFVGRLDPKADRKNKTLLIQQLWLEEHLDQLETFMPALANSLWEFATFNQCEKIELVQAGHPHWAKMLRDALKAQRFLTRNK